MSLNNINTNTFYEGPITLWKTKQRVHYRDDVVHPKKCVCSVKNKNIDKEPRIRDTDMGWANAHLQFKISTNYSCMHTLNHIVKIIIFKKAHGWSSWCWYEILVKYLYIRLICKSIPIQTFWHLFAISFL